MSDWKEVGTGHLRIPKYELEWNDIYEFFAVSTRIGKLLNELDVDRDGEYRIQIEPDKPHPEYKGWIINIWEEDESDE